MSKDENLIYYEAYESLHDFALEYPKKFYELITLRVAITYLAAYFGRQRVEIFRIIEIIQKLERESLIKE